MIRILIHEHYTRCFKCGIKTIEKVIIVMALHGFGMVQHGIARCSTVYCMCAQINDYRTLKIDTCFSNYNQFSIYFITHLQHVVFYFAPFFYLFAPLSVHSVCFSLLSSLWKMKEAILARACTLPRSIVDNQIDFHLMSHLSLHRHPSYITRRLMIINP